MATHQRLAVRKLVEQGVLTEAQFEAVMGALAAHEPRPRGKILAEIAAYIGAGLVFCGIALVIGASWDDLARGAQVALLIAVSVGLVLGAIAVVGGPSKLFDRDPHGSRIRLAGALLALAAGSVTGAVGTALDDGSADAGSWAALAGLVAAVLGYIAVPSVIGMLACGIFSASAIPVALDEMFGVGDLWVGFGMLVVGGIWFALSRIGAFVETWLGYAIAVGIALVGAIVVDSDHRPWAFLLSVLVAAVCFVLFAQQRSTVLVIGGGLAVALATGQAVTQWTDSVLTVAVAVLAIGAVALGVGSYVLTRSPKSSD
ncbi:DUF2157 domain-containing protein [Nocardia suismassiliense]|uniref:DUF2157 domain-containing protein n=1 Tax=Nocardia suismassiliense TaxID=2077092 RepID=UPI000D1EAFC5|nr:DUF2157 domain-containing protein [Nocardia suismassiliense]